MTQKRRPHPNSLANLDPNQTTPGMQSITVRIFAATMVGRWFREMSAADRGRLVTALHNSNKS